MIFRIKIKKLCCNLQQSFFYLIYLNQFFLFNCIHVGNKIKNLV